MKNKTLTSLDYFQDKKISNLKFIFGGGHYTSTSQGSIQEANVDYSADAKFENGYTMYNLCRSNIDNKVFYKDMDLRNERGNYY